MIKCTQDKSRREKLTKIVHDISSKLIGDSNKESGK